MIVKISEVIIGGAGNKHQDPQYHDADKRNVMSQPGCTGLQQINVQAEVEPGDGMRDMTALVGTNGIVILLGEAHLAALPCPPACQGKGEQ